MARVDLNVDKLHPTLNSKMCCMEPKSDSFVDKTHNVRRTCLERFFGEFTMGIFLSDVPSFLYKTPF